MIRDENYQLNNLNQDGEDNAEVVNSHSTLRFNGKVYFVMMNSDSFQNQEYGELEYLIAETTEEIADRIYSQESLYNNYIALYEQDYADYLYDQFYYDILNNPSLRLIKVKGRGIIESFIVSIDEVIHYFPGKDPMFATNYYFSMKKFEEFMDEHRDALYANADAQREKVYKEMAEHDHNYDNVTKMKLLNLVPWNSNYEKKMALKKLTMPESHFFYYCKDQYEFLDLMPWDGYDD